MTFIHDPLYNTRISQVATDAVILSQDQYNRTKKRAAYLTPAQILQNQQDEVDAKKMAMQSINLKRSKVIEAELLSQQKFKARQAELKDASRQRELEVARAKANEELDEVKLMNREVALARVKTVQDAELLMHKRKAEEERERERREAEEYEQGRLRAIQIYKEREDALREQRRLGAEYLLKQIEERKVQKKLEFEREAKERQAMMDACALAQEEDRRLAKERRQRHQEFLEECMEANKISIKRKQMEKERDAKEITAIIEYQRAKAAQEAAYEAEQQEKAAAKEREISEMRKNQQKLMDTRAEEDELRARRVQEELARKDREKELEQIRKRKEEREMLIKNAENARILKQKRLLQLAQLEKKEFEMQKAAIEKERRRREEEERKRIESIRAYEAELAEEVAARRAAKKLQPLVSLDEQQHVDDDNADYLAKLEEIRQQKLDMLRAEGVPERHLANLKRMRFVLK